MSALKQHYGSEAQQGAPVESFKFKIKGQVNCFIYSSLLRI